MSDPIDIEGLIQAVVDGAQEGLFLVAQSVLHESNENIGVGDPSRDPNPGESLKENGHIVPDGKGYIIVYDLPYATKQHEAQSFQHPRGGGPKFLERALIAHTAEIETVVGSRVRANLLGGSDRSHKRGGNKGRSSGTV